MADLAVIGITALCIGIVFLLIKWCGSQVNRSE